MKYRFLKFQKNKYSARKGLTIKTTKLLKPKHHFMGGANQFVSLSFLAYFEKFSS